VVHRIDRDTSGLVVFAKKPDAQGRLKEQFKRHEASRTYLAVVYGVPAPESGTWTDRLAWDKRALVQKKADAANPRSKEARSEYRVLERFDGASLLEVRLVTGKRNQIRFQAGLRGHPLVGETKYVLGRNRVPVIDFPRQALHAYRLGLWHPLNGRPLRFEAPVPPDLAELIHKLRKDGESFSPDRKSK
jgi:23S rRNA pseudouridine1911/1915/1917 synthase